MKDGSNNNVIVFLHFGKQHLINLFQSDEKYKENKIFIKLSFVL